LSCEVVNARFLCNQRIDDESADDPNGPPVKAFVDRQEIRLSIDFIGLWKSSGHERKEP
jgi:hypothetical protein